MIRTKPNTGLKVVQFQTFLMIQQPYINSSSTAGIQTLFAAKPNRKRTFFKECTNIRDIYLDFFLFFIFMFQGNKEKGKAISPVKSMA